MSYSFDEVLRFGCIVIPMKIESKRWNFMKKSTKRMWLTIYRRIEWRIIAIFVIFILNAIWIGFCIMFTQAHKFPANGLFNDQCKWKRVERGCDYNSPKSRLLAASTQCAAVTTVRPPEIPVKYVTCYSFQNGYFFFIFYLCKRRCIPTILIFSVHSGIAAEHSMDNHKLTSHYHR